MTGIASYRDIVDAARAHPEALVTVERDGPVATLTLDDPGKLNVLSAALSLQLREAAEELVRDREIRAVVLTGAGRGFSAGGDLRLMEQGVASLHDGAGEGSFLMWSWIREQFGGMARTIARSDVAWIAALNGPAAGVGLAYALTADLAIASEDAILVPAFGRLGLLPEVGTSWALTRALGYRRAFAFFVGGEHLGARDALELGLVNEVVPAEDLLVTAQGWARRAADLPEHALRMGKALLRQCADLPWEQAIAMEEFAEPTCFTTRPFADAVESLIAAR